MSTAMAASFEALYSAYSRMQVQQTWASILNAPVELEDVLIAEWLWAATKSMFSGLAIIAVMLALGISRSPMLLLLLPVIVLTGPGLRRYRPVLQRAGPWLRFLHLLLHAGDHPDGFYLGRLLPDDRAAGLAGHAGALAAAGGSRSTWRDRWCWASGPPMRRSALPCWRCTAWCRS
jgi:hypothetical protein